MRHRPACRPRPFPIAAVLGVLGALAGCGTVTADRRDEAAPSFTAIAPEETISLAGTEPFWGGTISGGTLDYSTPEIASTKIAVRRFAGLNGLGFSGTLSGQAIDLAISQTRCSDGMSDRQYPFTATLRIGGETRNGCAWTARTPFSGPETP